MNLENNYLEHCQSKVREAERQIIELTRNISLCKEDMKDIYIFTEIFYQRQDIEKEKKELILKNQLEIQKYQFVIDSNKK